MAHSLTALVVSYQLAYNSADEATLCDACVERGDHECGPLGPVLVGKRVGQCDGANHRSAPRVSRPAALLRTALIVSGFLTLFTGLARAEEKRPRPVVCVDFREATVGASKLGACFDGRKPVVWSIWHFVTIEDAEGNPRRVAVGFR